MGPPPSSSSSHHVGIITKWTGALKRGKKYTRRTNRIGDFGRRLEYDQRAGNPVVFIV
jgi:hypothetical protein